MELLKARITGRVQGVGFRHFVMTRARELGLNGWVRNTRDGAVELEAEGRREDLKKLLEEVKRGPSPAYVEDIVAEWKEAEREMERFRVRF